MELILLGTSSAYPTIERASSGYLLRDENTAVLLDMGNGVFRNLQQWQDARDLDAIIITHLHQDHFIDIYPLYYFLVFHKDERLPIPVYAPRGTRDFILRIMPESTAEEIDQVFTFCALQDRERFTMGSFEVTPFEVAHSADAFGMRVEGAATVAYSSDSDYDPVLVELARDADVLICEATMQIDYDYLKHLTGEQAGIIARDAMAKHLILTHIWPDLDIEESFQQAKRFYEGEITIARDNMRIEL